MLEPHDDVVGVPDHDHVTRGLAPSPALSPEVENVVKVNVREQRRDHRALSRPLLLNRYHLVFKDPGPQPFLDEPEDALIADLVFQEADNPFLGDLREERPDIGVQYEAHFLAADPDVECVQRIVLAAPRPEPVREPEEICLVNLVQHRRHCSLDDLVFEGGDRERALGAEALIRLDFLYEPHGDAGRNMSSLALDSINSAFNTLIAKGLPAVQVVVDKRLKVEQAGLAVMQDIMRFLLDNPAARHAHAVNFPAGSNARRVLEVSAAVECDDGGVTLSDDNEEFFDGLGLGVDWDWGEDGITRDKAARVFARQQSAVERLTDAKGALQRALATQSEFGSRVPSL